MASSGMLCHVALVRIDVSEELSASFIRVIKIGELGTTLAVTSNRRMLQRNTISSQSASVASYCWRCSYFTDSCSSETSVLTRATWHNIPEGAIPHGHRHENLKSYKCRNVVGSLGRCTIEHHGLQYQLPHASATRQIQEAINVCSHYNRVGAV
jgi:hypothetical protein